MTYLCITSLRLNKGYLTADEQPTHKTASMTIDLNNGSQL